MNAPTTTAPAAAFVRGIATWYGYLLIGSYLYLLNVQGNVIPFLQGEFALSYRVVSLHSSAFAVGIIITGLFGERVVRRFGRRVALRLGAGGLGAGALLLVVAPAAWASIASCALMGLFGGLVPSVVPAVFADLHGERRGQAYAEQAILAYTFAIVGPLATGFFVANSLGWRYAVVIGGILALGLIVIFRNVAVPEAADPTLLRRAHLPAPFWAYFALLCSSCAFEYSMVLWAPAFLERVTGFSPAAAATGAAGFFAGVLAGRIALRILLTRLRPQTIMLTALATGIVGFGFYWGTTEPWAAIVGIVLLGLCLAPLYPLTMALAIGAARGVNDAASARLNLAAGIALLVAPAVLGFIADGVGLRLAHLTLPVLILSCLVCFAVARTLERRAT